MRRHACAAAQLSTLSHRGWCLSLVPLATSLQVATPSPNALPCAPFPPGSMMVYKSYALCGSNGKSLVDRVVVVVHNPPAAHQSRPGSDGGEGQGAEGRRTGEE